MLLITSNMTDLHSRRNFSELASHISQVATDLPIYFPQMLDNQLQPNQIFSRHFGVVKFIPRQLRKKKISRLEVLSDVPSFHQKARPCLSIAQPGGALLLSNIFKAFKVKITQQGRLYFSPLGLFLFSRHSMSLKHLMRFQKYKNIKTIRYDVK